MTIFHFGRGLHHHGPFHLLVLSALVVLVVVAVIALTHALRRPPSPAADVAWNPPLRAWPPTAPVDPALAELRMGYARGELSFEQYQERAARLGYASPPGTAPETPDGAPPPGS